MTFLHKINVILLQAGH